MQNTESVIDLDEKIINKIKDIFSENTEIGEARKKMATDTEIKPLYKIFRFKVEEKNKHGKCIVTLSRRDGQEGDLPIQVHLRSIPRDQQYPSRNIYDELKNIIR